MSCDKIADVSSFNDTPVFSYACLRAQRILVYSSLQACGLYLYKLDCVTLHCLCACVHHWPIGSFYFKMILVEIIVFSFQNKYLFLLGNRKLHGCTLANLHLYIALKILQEDKKVSWLS